jgi:Toprim-like
MTAQPESHERRAACHAESRVKGFYILMCCCDVAVEALSYHTLFAGRHDRFAIVSCSGSFVPEELMFQAYDRRQSFVVALNNDVAGELGWQMLGTIPPTGPDSKSPLRVPQRNDWNADLVASFQVKHPA